MCINLGKVIRAMSVALDLAEISSIEDQNIVENVSNIKYIGHNFLHHSKRTTYISLKIAEELNLDENTRKQLYISALLHDIGAASYLKRSHSSNTFIKEHCILGSTIIKSFPFYSTLSHIVLYHHENCDGSGCMKLTCNEIPLESQIIRLADSVELLYDEKISSYSQKEALVNWVESNRNTIFSEQITEAFLKISKKDIFWFDIENISFMDFILDNISPTLDIDMSYKDFEQIAYIFAKIIDNKSSFTAKHSNGIAELAYNVSKHLCYSEEKCLKMKIAGLLHDIGKLAIPTAILDKNGALNDEEFSVIKSHVYYTKIILDKIEDIPEISTWASNHHEKLNGKGYPRSLSPDEICEEARIMCACDIYQALTEDRPYRSGLNQQKAFAILDGMVSDGFVCKDAVLNLKNTLNYEIQINGGIKKMSKIKACIFDLDGVVVDTAKYHYLAWKRLANELGFEFTKEDNERLKGVSRMDSLEILLEIGHQSFDENTKLELAAKKNSWYVEYISTMDESEILPGVKEFFLLLKENGMKISLGSVSKNAMKILNSIHLTQYFDAIIDGTKVTNAKPDPEVFLKGAEALKVLPSECVVFEDAVAGIEGAINAKMVSIGVGSPDILTKANKVISGFENLNLSILEF